MTHVVLWNNESFHMRWYLIAGEWHSRIDSERLTNCSLEWPLFAAWEEEPKHDSHRVCEKCDRLIEMVKSVRPYDDRAKDTPL